jgi:arabinoxylan arabinofuranohydrolase
MLKVDINASGEGNSWKTVNAQVDTIKGVHDLFLVFRGEKDLLNFDWRKFNAQ